MSTVGTRDTQEGWNLDATDSGAPPALREPSTPSVDRVAVSGGLPLFPSRRVGSTKHPIHHPDPQSTAPRPYHVI